MINLIGVDHLNKNYKKIIKILNEINPQVVSVELEPSSLNELYHNHNKNRNNDYYKEGLLQIEGDEVFAAVDYCMKNSKQLFALDSFFKINERIVTIYAEDNFHIYTSNIENKFLYKLFDKTLNQLRLFKIKTSIVKLEKKYGSVVFIGGEYNIKKMFSKNKIKKHFL